MTKISEIIFLCVLPPPATAEKRWLVVIGINARVLETKPVAADRIVSICSLAITFLICKPACCCESQLLHSHVGEQAHLAYSDRKSVENMQIKHKRVVPSLCFKRRHKSCAIKRCVGTIRDKDML